LLKAPSVCHQVHVVYRENGPRGEDEFLDYPDSAEITSTKNLLQGLVFLDPLLNFMKSMSRPVALQGGMYHVFPQPDNGSGAILIDSLHLGDLASPLGNIILVNANRVDPNQSDSPLRPQIAK
jgi:hypothetical protein